MSLLVVKNKVLKPQDEIPSKDMPGFDVDYKVKSINLKEDLKGSYIVLFSFPLGLKADSEEVLNFDAHVEEFKNLGCHVVGLTNESPLAVKRWMKKDLESGGFGKSVGFPIISDKDLFLSMHLGIARECGLPARAAFIIDKAGRVRYSTAHKSSVKFSISELLRLVYAVKTSDMTGKATPATWNGNEEDLVPTDYTDKLAYFKKKYGSPSPDINLIKESFKVFDSNSDGLINADEIKPTTMGFKEIPDDALKQMFQKVDRNQDGFIDLREFRELVSMLAEKYPWSPPSKDSAPGLAKTTDASKPDRESPSNSSKPDDKAQSKSANPGDEKPETGANSAEQKNSKPSKPDDKAQSKSSIPGDEKTEKSAEQGDSTNSENKKVEK